MPLLSVLAAPGKVKEFLHQRLQLKMSKQRLIFLKLEQSLRTFAVDTSNILLIGYSYGGGMALLGSLQGTSVRKVCSIAGGDLGVIGRMIEQNPNFRKSHERFLDKYMSNPTVSRGLGGKATHELTLKHIADFDLKTFADKLARKNILLLGGWQDYTIPIEDHLLPLYRSLQKNKAERLEIQVFDADHSFENVKASLIAKIIMWLCGK